MTPTEAAILRTVLYGDVFNFALTPPEIHHFLIADTPIAYQEIQHTLETSRYLKTVLEIEQGYVVCAGRLELIPVRLRREEISSRLWALAEVYGVWLSRLPFVRMVALTGALAMRNPADQDDDLDYMLVTTPNRVWLARAFSILLVRVVKLRGVVICPNYVLAISALAQSKHDVFMAHEVAQMIPLYDTRIYRAMREANGWVRQHMPNAETPFYPQQNARLGRFWGGVKQFTEIVLGGGIGDALERWEYERKSRRFAREIRTPNSAALIDAEHVKGHFNDHGHPIMAKYRERLRQYELEALPLAGD